MQPSSFTIEFGTPVPDDKQKYCLDHLAEDATETKALGQRKYEIVCLRKSRLLRVGWALFQTHFSQICNVIDVSCDAEARADAYRHRPFEIESAFIEFSNPLLWLASPAAH